MKSAFGRRLETQETTVPENMMKHCTIVTADIAVIGAKRDTTDLSFDFHFGNACLSVTVMITVNPTPNIVLHSQSTSRSQSSSPVCGGIDSNEDFIGIFFLGDEDSFMIHLLKSVSTQGDYGRMKKKSLGFLYVNTFCVSLSQSQPCYSVSLHPLHHDCMRGQSRKLLAHDLIKSRQRIILLHD
jgi:hypothetical protein